MLWSQQAFWTALVIYDGSTIWATKGKIQIRNYQTYSKTKWQTSAEKEAQVGFNPPHQSSVDVGCWEKETLAEISAKYKLLF